jgi:hypothetical protein
MRDFEKIELLENKIENLNDDLYCVHHYLTQKGIPTKDDNGNTYSIVGRINLLENKLVKEYSEKLSKQINELFV